MNIRIAQLKVSKNIQENVEKIKKVIEESREGEWVLFPEGMISGYYPEDKDFLSKLNPEKIDSAIDELEGLVVSKKVNCLIGTALRIDGGWFNTIVVFIDGKKIIYKKNNLSTLDRNHFKAGSEIKAYGDNSDIFGLAMCRELSFPEQWRLLKKKKAKVVFHINNAIKVSDKVREKVLVTRAFENQYWVCSVNNADNPQSMRSMIINPLGEVIWASAPQKEEVFAAEIDLDLVKNYYIDEAREDLVGVEER